MRTNKNGQPLQSIQPISTAGVQWPQDVNYGWLAGSVLSLIGVVIGALCVARGIREDEVAISLGFAAFSCTMGLASVGMLRSAGFRWLRLSRRISTGERAHGSGVVVPTGRMVAFLISVLACGAVFALTASISWHLGIGESLLPASRDNSAGANFMGICGAVLLVFAIFFLGFRAPAVLRMTPAGIAYHLRFRRGFRVVEVDNVASWADITTVTPETQVVNAGQSTVYHPLVRIGHQSADRDEATSPEEQEFVIRVHALVVEPNTLYSLMVHMYEHPEDRDLLAREDAAQLLTPPPLRDRFGAARAAKKAEKAKKRASRPGMPPNA